MRRCEDSIPALSESSSLCSSSGGDISYGSRKLGPAFDGLFEIGQNWGHQHMGNDIIVHNLWWALEYDWIISLCAA